MNPKKIIEITERYCAHNYAPLPVVVHKAKDVFVWDLNGKRYIDMIASYSALNFGHRHPKIINAVKKQLENVTLTSRAYYNDRMGEFLGKLTRIAKQELALPMNTGSEAVETALKAIRKWAYNVKGIEKNKAEVIVCNNNFHGRTITIISFSSEPLYKDNFGPYTPGFKSIDFNNTEQLEKAINENTAAFLVEPIQGEGGIIIPKEGYLKEVRKICNENNILLVLDEIQTGLGRTGKMFAYEHEKIKPDVLILGKALGGGIYPISAVLASKEILDFKPGEHGSTFGGNPLASAIGIAALEVTAKERLAKKAAINGSYFLKRLKEINSDCIKEARGKGLLIGLEIKKEYGDARRYCEKLLEKGIICKETHEQTIRLTPPLTIKKQHIDYTVKAISEVLNGY